MNDIEQKIRKIAVQIYAHGYDDCDSGIRIEEIDEGHRTWADEHILAIMALIGEVIGEDEEYISCLKDKSLFIQSNSRNQLRREQRKRAALV